MAQKDEATEVNSATGPASKNPELDRIYEYLNRDPKYRADRFDGYGLSNDHQLLQLSDPASDPAYYYYLKAHPEAARTRSCIAIESVAFSEIAQDTPMVYVPCGISSGLRAHEVLDQHNTSRQPTDEDWGKSTYKLEEYIGAGAHRSKVLGPNKDDNLRRANIIGGVESDKMIVAPVIREGAVREITRTGAFARWQRYEEEDYMAFWFPLIDRCKGMRLDGDWNYSRNSLWEMMRGVLIQAGQIPSRPQADMEVLDLEGRPVTLLARAEKAAEMLKYQLGKQFEPREAATVLAQIFTIDEDIRAGKIPTEGRSLNPVLELRTSKELLAMDALKKEIEPILLKYCAQYMRLDDLPEKYREAAENPPSAEEYRQIHERFRDFADDISRRQEKLLSIEPSRELSIKLAEKDQLPQRQYDSYERFFEKGAQAKMFEDDLYGKLSQWEQLALPFAIGATEIGLYPTAHPMATMVLTDLKRGKEGFRRAQDAGVDDMNEFAGTLGRDISEVISANTQEAETLKAKLKMQNPNKVVVNTLSFLRIADAIEHERKADVGSRFIAAPGPTETSPQMRLALQMKYLDRNVDRAVFQEGWEHSNDLVQLRVRARLIQAGLVERPAGAQSSMRVVSAADPAMPQTLLEDIKLLTAEVKRAAEANIQAPEQALALARLITLHELLIDPDLRASGDQALNGEKPTREVINPLTADTSLTCYDREEAKIVTLEAKALLTSKAARWIPRERLYVEPYAKDDADRAAAKVVQNRRMQEYLKAQGGLQSQDAWAKKRDEQDGLPYRRDGANR